MSLYYRQCIAYIARLPKETWLLIFLGGLLSIIWIRLFQLQVIHGPEYEQKLIDQHYTFVSIQAKRGNIFVYDRGGKNLQLTNNIDLYDISVDPKFIRQKSEFIQTMLPIIYRHLCEVRGTQRVNGLSCVRNIEKFTKQMILPDNNTGFYLSGKDNERDLTGWVALDTQLTNAMQLAISGFQKTTALDMMKSRLESMLYTWVRPQNFFRFIENDDLLKALESARLPRVSVSNNYVYFIPANVTNSDTAAQAIKKILDLYGYTIDIRNIQSQLLPKENRSVLLMQHADGQTAKRINDIKIADYKELQKHIIANRTLKKQWLPPKYNTYEGITMFHGVRLDKSNQRYYPLGTFMSNVLWFVNRDGYALYGIEKYFDDLLKWSDGQIIGLWTPWIGQVGSNELDVKPTLDGTDVYLTIEPTIQKSIEQILKQYQIEFRADSLSAIVMNPYNGKIIASANYPTFDPNSTDEVNQYKPLGVKEKYLLEDNTFVDVPMYIASGDMLSPATSDQRSDTTLPKYIHKNIVGPLVFKDKNISLPYEPGSIFKGITMGVGLDTDEIWLYDFYEDVGKLQVGEYLIKNVSLTCLWTNTFLHALQFSCNVGMIRIIQKIKPQVFYRYLEKIWLGKQTGIELDGEDAGSIPNANTISKAGFFNNSFGQGLTVTPLQMAQAYSILVNGGYYIKPTLIDKFVTPDRKVIQNNKFERIKIFKDTTSDAIKEALFQVVNGGQIKKFAIPGFTLWGKTGTSQISYKGKYQQWAWRTNGSFAGILTKNNLKYVIIVQVRRPRQSVWWELTAGKIYGEIAKFIISYEGILN